MISARVGGWIVVGGRAVDIAQRIERLLHEEHARLIEGAAALDAAVIALPETLPRDLLREATPAPVQKRGLTEAPNLRSEAPEMRRLAGPNARLVSTRALKVAWAAFYERLRVHLRHEQELLEAATRAIAPGRMAPWLTRLDEDHDALRTLAGRVRGEAQFIEPFRRPVRDVLDLFETHTRIIESELFPAFAATAGVATPVGAVRHRTPDDVARALRQARPATAAPAADTKAGPGWTDTLRRWWSGA